MSEIPNEAATQGSPLFGGPSPAAGGASTAHSTADADGSNDNTAMRTKFSAGTKKSSAIHGLAPASAARRIVMLTPIHRNGSAMATSNGMSHPGAPRSSSVRVLNKGDR